MALDDLDEIHAFIEDTEGADAADRLLDSLYDCFGRIAGSPGLGHRRPDLTGYDVFSGRPCAGMR
nr:type II toxin-antitoxin system RelE/ParE family toxin [Azospirillum endophyticum]